MQSGIESMNDMQDLDGNGKIDVAAVDAFYSDVESQFSAIGASFTNVTFRPATSFSLVEHASNATYGKVTFDGLTDGQNVSLGSGQHGAQERFYDVKFDNVCGGEIRINDYAIVNNLDVRGQQCSLTIGGRAQLNDLHAEGAHFLHLTAEPGAQIVRGNFKDTIIDMASHLDGSIWRNCEFDGATLRDVNFRGAQLAETHFVNCDMAGVDFTGARLSNCSITGDISKINAANAYFHNVTITDLNGMSTVVNSAAEFKALQQANAIGVGMADSINALKGNDRSTPTTLAGLGASLGNDAAQTSLLAQQAAGAAATPAQPVPAPGQGASVSF